jgi:hypothetical protein
MNRIYQGKVTKVEAPDGKQGWKPLSNQEWQDALWQHHQLFQAEFYETPLSCAANAVNYYTLALAAMA